MRTNIPLDEAELLSMLLEAILYGISVPMFGGTIWVLLFRRNTGNINRGVLAASCLLLVCSTGHLVIHVIRTMDGLTSPRHTHPGGPNAFFSDPSQWTFVSKNYVYTAQTLIGDGVILYRCYVVWRSKLIMVLPVVLWCAVVVTGTVAPYTESRARQNEVFDGSVSQWITAFWTTTLATNLVTTLLLSYRIWRTDRQATSSFSHRKSRLRPVLHIILDAGIIYSLTLFAALVCFTNRSNGQFVTLDVVTPIISITFYMVIIRVALAGRVRHSMDIRAGGFPTTNHSTNVDRRSRTQIFTSFVNNTDNGVHFEASQTTSSAVDNSHSENENKFGNVATAV